MNMSFIKEIDKKRERKPRRKEIRVCCTATQLAFRTHFYCLLVCIYTAEARKHEGGVVDDNWVPPPAGPASGHATRAVA